METFLWTNVTHFTHGSVAKQLLFEAGRAVTLLMDGFASNHVNAAGMGSGGLQCSKIALGGGDVTVNEECCVGCRMPFEYLARMRSFTPVEREDAIEILNETSTRFKLYYGHVHSLKAQQVSFHSTLHEIISIRMHHCTSLL